MTEDSMTTIEAIKHVTDIFDIPSAYALAKSLSDEDLKVQTIQITNYLSGKHKMSRKVADRFYECYGIVINDAFDKSNWIEAVQKAKED